MSERSADWINWRYNYLLESYKSDLKAFKKYQRVPLDQRDAAYYDHMQIWRETLAKELKEINKLKEQGAQKINN